MKIGILTYCKVANFGANLQALSTYCYLQNHGFEPIIIDWFPLDFERRICKENNSLQARAHFDFVKAYMNFTKTCRTTNEVIEIINSEKIKGIIVGSDAVLQHTPVLQRLRLSRKSLLVYLNIDSTRSFPNPFWGDWLNSITVPAVIMSASNQGCNFYKYPGVTMKKMTHLLQKFNYLSVRDEWTKKMVQYVTKGKINPDITPDPVFGFKYNCKQLIPSKSTLFEKYGIRKPYVLLSFRTLSLINDLGDKWFRDLIGIFEKQGYECYLLPMPNGLPYKYADVRTITVPLNPIDWYALIQNAAGYIGQNMHPIVTALSNGTPLFCFDDYANRNPKQKSKVEDILEIFSVGDNCTNVYRHGNIYPSPEFVYKKIIDFTSNYDSEQENKYHIEYENMMKSITSVFVEK